MKQNLTIILAALGCALLVPDPASACGGFFCSQSPVDQNAERIVFAVDEASDTTDMIVQITYQGDDDAFAWVLPVGSVPQNREVFPSTALSSLDSQTGPTFQPPAECSGRWAFAPAAGGFADGGVARSDAGTAPPPVVVHVMETVDSFDVAVIESTSAEATFQWLVDNKYRLSSVMKPYIEYYTAQRMMFLALKLTANATAKDIKPFKMTLPGITPTIPLRLTAIAAEPEMGVVVWIVGQRRYEPANAEEFTIPKEELRWQPYTFPIRTNWTQLVARHVDALGGKGWVVDQAGPSAPLLQLAQGSFVSTPDQMKARDALVKLLSGRPYLTRLYTRVAAEEMSYDPSFRRSDKGDVARQRELPFIEEICSADAGVSPPTYPCDFAACGQLGLCREVMNAQTKIASAGCACPPGTSARTTFDPQGQAMVTCQDQRMSFMNPGERDEAGAAFVDPCVGYSCGDHGKCVAMNLTPTCSCDEGYVAIGSIGANGLRQTQCVLPTMNLPKNFYNRRPPQLAAGMVAGRAVELPPPPGVPDVEMADNYGEPMPNGVDEESAAKSKDSGCRSSPGETAGGASGLLSLLALGALLARRRRS